VLTAIVSDLHLGTTSSADIARGAEVHERMLEALAEADRVVLLGDLLELREAAPSEVLKSAGPFLSALGAACPGKPVVIVPGNHDHELIAPALNDARLRSAAPLASAAEFDPATGPLSRAVADLIEGAEVSLAYPGIWLREDVFATHGHYLDAHLTVPRMECVFASLVGRAEGIRPEDFTTPDDYEASLSPIYALAQSLVQRQEAVPVSRGGSLSRSIYGRSSESSLTGRAIGRVGIPLAVAALNAAGLGPFRADISAVELRRAGLRAMGEVLDRLSIDAEHVVFGHTHRVGPLPGDVEGWTLPGGARLHNTGSWLHEQVFLGDRHDTSNPYFPGWVTYIGDEGPPERRNVLEDYVPARTAAI
jgi:UDP-2,3-diacylglucosamine pyrophosphatase LpxH